MGWGVPEAGHSCCPAHACPLAGACRVWCGSFPFLLSLFLCRMLPCNSRVIDAPVLIGTEKGFVMVERESEKEKTRGRDTLSFFCRQKSRLFPRFTPHTHTHTLMARAAVAVALLAVAACVAGWPFDSVAKSGLPLNATKLPAYLTGNNTALFKEGLASAKGKLNSSLFNTSGNVVRFGGPGERGRRVGGAPFRKMGTLVLG